jgi:hypothetical protein
MRPPIDRENTLTLLREWQKHHDALVSLMDGIEATIGLAPDGPMYDTVWKVFDAYTNTLAVEVGDYCSWLEWHYVENDMGAKAMEAGYDKKLCKIKTLVDLARLIEESRKRKGT